MRNKEQLKPLTIEQRRFAEDNYKLIMDFLKKSRLNAEEYFDIAVFGYLLSVEIYLNNAELQRKCSFEAVSYMHMKRAVFDYLRKQKAQKRSTEAGSNISLDLLDISNHSITENVSDIEYKEILKQIESRLTEEQRKIFFYKIDGYTLKEIADSNGIKPKQIYKQYGKIKQIVAEIMEIRKDGK